MSTASNTQTAPHELEAWIARIVAALRASNGNKSEAAQRLCWCRMTLYRKIARYGIDVTTACDSATQPMSQL